MSKIRIVNAETQKPVANILLMATILAKRKNNFIILLPISDANGVIHYDLNYLIKEIKKQKDMFPMDYCAELDQCERFAEIQLPTNDILRNIMHFQTMYGFVAKKDKENFDNLSNNFFNEKVKKIVLSDHSEMTFCIQPKNSR